MTPDFSSAIACPWFRTGSPLDLSRPFPALVKYTARNIDNPMAHWKVIALINGDIEAVSGPAAPDRPGAHEWMVWQGTAADKAEAVQSAEKAVGRYRGSSRHFLSQSVFAGPLGAERAAGANVSRTR